eukprot:15228680-Alexandrium_andersonii.AAC.1
MAGRNPMSRSPDASARNCNGPETGDNKPRGRNEHGAKHATRRNHGSMPTHTTNHAPTDQRHQRPAKGNVTMCRAEGNDGARRPRAKG